MNIVLHQQEKKNTKGDSQFEEASLKPRRILYVKIVVARVLKRQSPLPQIRSS